MSEEDIARFLEAQDELYCGYKQALAEIRAGRKSTHWIWYIFPQLRGLGYSRHAHLYGICGREEAARYLAHPLLGSRLRGITQALLQHRGKDAEAILGSVDALKVCSSMTLFDALSPSDIFAEVLEEFYGGRRCAGTVKMLSAGEQSGEGDE